MNALPQTPLSPDARRCLGLFDRYGRRRAGRGLRRSALAILAEDPGFDLWAGLAELVERRLVRAEGGSRWLLTEAGAARMRQLLGAGASPDHSSGPAAPPAGIRGIAA